MNNKIFWISLLAVSTTVATLGYWQYRKLTGMCLKFGDVKIDTISQAKISFTISIKLKNISLIPIHLIANGFDISVNNTKVVHVKSDVITYLKPGEWATMPININIDGATLLNVFLSNIGNLLNNRDKVTIGIKGKLSIDVGVAAIGQYEISRSLTLKEIQDMASSGKESSGSHTETGKKTGIDECSK